VVEEASLVHRDGVLPEMMPRLLQAAPTGRGDAEIDTRVRL